MPPTKREAAELAAAPKKLWGLRYTCTETHAAKWFNHYDGEDRCPLVFYSRAAALRAIKARAANLRSREHLVPAVIGIAPPRTEN